MDKKQNALMSKLMQSYDEPEESRKPAEGELLGQVTAKSIAKISNGIKED